MLEKLLAALLTKDLKEKTMLEKLLVLLLPKLLEFLQSDAFKALLDRLIKGLEELLDSAK